MPIRKYIILTGMFFKGHKMDIVLIDQNKTISHDTSNF